MPIRRLSVCTLHMRGFPTLPLETKLYELERNSLLLFPIFLQSSLSLFLSFSLHVCLSSFFSSSVVRVCRPLRDLNVKYLRAHQGIVSQEPKLFSVSVRTTPPPTPPFPFLFPPHTHFFFLFSLSLSLVPLSCMQLQPLSLRKNKQRNTRKKKKRKRSMQMKQ